MTIAPPPAVPPPTLVVVLVSLSAALASASSVSCSRSRLLLVVLGVPLPPLPLPRPRPRPGVPGVLLPSRPRPRPGVLGGVAGPRPGLPGVTILRGRPRPRRGVSASSDIFIFYYLTFVRFRWSRCGRRCLAAVVSAVAVAFDEVVSYLVSRRPLGLLSIFLVRNILLLFFDCARVCFRSKTFPLCRLPDVCLTNSC